MDVPPQLALTSPAWTSCSAAPCTTPRSRRPIAALPGPDGRSTVEESDRQSTHAHHPAHPQRRSTTEQQRGGRRARLISPRRCFGRTSPESLPDRPAQQQGRPACSWGRVVDAGCRTATASGRSRRSRSFEVERGLCRAGDMVRALAGWMPTMAVLAPRRRETWRVAGRNEAAFGADRSVRGASQSSAPSVRTSVRPSRRSASSMPPWRSPAVLPSSFRPRRQRRRSIDSDARLDHTGCPRRRRR
jgi:hypothetical protein